MTPMTVGRYVALVMVFSLLTACGGGAASPTAAPKATDKPAETKPAASPAAAPAAPAASPAAAAKSAAAGQMPWESPGAGLVKGALEGDARQLTGAGATFPAPLYTKWFEQYNQLANVQINYQSIGSGGGIKALTDSTADFGASDAIMTAEQKTAAKGDVLHIPMTLGAVVPTYNLPGLENTKVKFTGETLAGIFLGDIKKWNDPKLMADNPGVNLPDKEIVVVARSDGSGTTFIWTDYLSSVSETWKSKVGKATSVNWPTGLGAKGNEGVAGEVKQSPNAIGYVELAYAMQNKLAVGTIKNKAGSWVEPSLQSTTAAAAGAAANMPANLEVSIVNPDGAEAWPVSSFTWLLVRKEQTEKPKAQALTRVMWWATHDGQKLGGDLHYAPLPAAVVTKVEDQIKAVTVGGQPAFPGR